MKQEKGQNEEKFYDAFTSKCQIFNNKKLPLLQHDAQSRPTVGLVIACGSDFNYDNEDIEDDSCQKNVTCFVIYEPKVTSSIFLNATKRTKTDFFEEEKKLIFGFGILGMIIFTAAIILIYQKVHKCSL